MLIADSGLSVLRALPMIEVLPLLGTPLAFILGFLIFLLRCALFGMPRSPRLDQLADSKLIPRVILEYGYWFLQLPVRALVAIGITPNQVTTFSLLLAWAAGERLAEGHMALGGWLLFASHTADGLDGMVARATGKSSERGAYFDALIDRYSDFGIYFGLMWYYQNQHLPLALTAVALIGSSVMGYARAKGAAVGIDPNVGWMARHERGVAIGSATVLSPIIAAFVETGSPHPQHYLLIFTIALVALLTNITSIQRAVYVMRRLPLPKPPAV